MLDAFHADGWCRIAMHVSAEIRNCLIGRIVEKNCSTLMTASKVLEAQIAAVRIQMVERGCTPAEFDRMLQAICDESLKEAAADKGTGRKVDEPDKQ